MSNFDRDPLWAERSASKPACTECHHVHPSNDGRAVGIFRPEGPRGFMANYPAGAIYATRAEAERDICNRRQSTAQIGA